MGIPCMPGCLQALAQLTQCQSAHATGCRFQGVGDSRQGGGVACQRGGGDIGHLPLGVDEKFVQQALVQGRVVAHQISQRVRVPDGEAVPPIGLVQRVG